MVDVVHPARRAGHGRLPALRQRPGRRVRLQDRPAIRGFLADPPAIIVHSRDAVRVHARLDLLDDIADVSDAPVQRRLLEA